MWWQQVVRRLIQRQSGSLSWRVLTSALCLSNLPTVNSSICLNCWARPVSCLLVYWSIQNRIIQILKKSASFPESWRFLRFFFKTPYGAAFEIHWLIPELYREGSVYDCRVNAFWGLSEARIRWVGYISTLFALLAVGFVASKEGIWVCICDFCSWNERATTSSVIIVYQ